MPDTTLTTINNLATLLVRYSRYALTCDEGREVFEKQVKETIEALNQIK